MTIWRMRSRLWTKLTQAHVDSKWVKRCLLYLVLILSVSCINEVFLCFWILNFTIFRIPVQKR
ncbi:Uncharacterised protein [Vibrio cholerae]|nr:Uncharacterised protein [Vibrio cholerae]